MRASFLERRDLIVGLLNEVPGIDVRDARRRVLRVAERHRGVPDDRLRGLGGVPQAAAARGRRRGARRHPLRPPRARRRPAHPLLVRGVERGDRATASTRSTTFVRRATSASMLRRFDDNRAAREAVAGAGAQGAAARRDRSQAPRAAARDLHRRASRTGPRPGDARPISSRASSQRATDMAEHRRAHRRPREHSARRRALSSTRWSCRRRSPMQKSRRGRLLARIRRRSTGPAPDSRSRRGRRVGHDRPRHHRLLSARSPRPARW